MPGQLKITLVNILYPTPSLPLVIGGAERSCQNLAEALATAGHEISVIRGAPPGINIPNEVFNGVSIYSLPIKNKYWQFDGKNRNNLERLKWHIIDDWGHANSDFFELVKALNSDVVHTNNISGFGANIFSRLNEMKIPIVHTLRDYYLTCPRTNRYKNNSVCSRTCTDCKILTLKRKFETRFLSAIVSNSKYTLDVHRNLGFFDDTPIQEVIFNISDPKKVEMREYNKPITFGFIGRISRDKGCDLLISSIENIDIPYNLIFAGRADENFILHAREKCKNRVEFMGFVDPEEFYSRVDVVVAPSLWEEPLPRSVLDAISRGIPAVGSNVGGTREAIGPAGWIFDVSDANGLGELLLKLASNPNAVRETAKETAAQSALFHSKNVVKSYVEVYRNSIKSRMGLP